MGVTLGRPQEGPILEFQLDLRGLPSPPSSPDQMGHVFVDFDPPYQYIQKEEEDIIHVYLTGFEKEQLNVQAKGDGKVTIIGERPLPDNRWSRVHKEFPVPNHCNTQKIAAKFDDGLLQIILPKQPPPPPPPPPPPAAAGVRIILGDFKVKLGSLACELHRRKQLLMGLAVVTVVSLGIGFYLHYKLISSSSQGERT